MARMVPAVQVAVTGTPVSRGLEDLQGLFALGGPRDAVGRLGWGWCRNRTKHITTVMSFTRRLRRLDVAQQQDVADEPALPPQGQTVTWGASASGSAHWYQQQRKVRGFSSGRAREDRERPQWLPNAEERVWKERMQACARAHQPPGTGADAGWEEASSTNSRTSSTTGKTKHLKWRKRIVDLTANDDDDEDRYLTAESRKVLQPHLPAPGVTTHRRVRR